MAWFYHGSEWANVPYTAFCISDCGFSELEIHLLIEVVAQKEAPKSEQGIHFNRTSISQIISFFQAVLLIFEVGLLRES